MKLLVMLLFLIIGLALAVKLSFKVEGVADKAIVFFIIGCITVTILAVLVGG